MAIVKDYTSGKVLNNVKLTLYSLKLIKIPILGSLVKKELLKRIESFEPKLINIEQASELIYESNKCATGERVCMAINNDSQFTESVFLDELAEGMVRTEKAKFVEKEEAINTLQKYPKNSLICGKMHRIFLPHKNL